MSTLGLAIKLPRQSVIELGEFLGKPLRIFLHGEREVKGVLRSHDKLANLVLEGAVETRADGWSRSLGVVYVRGSSVESILEPASMRVMGLECPPE